MIPSASSFLDSSISTPMGLGIISNYKIPTFKVIQGTVLTFYIDMTNQIYLYNVFN